MFEAPQRRLAFCRDGTLWAALAAEAYVNQFLYEADKKTFDQLEDQKAPTIGKSGDGRPGKYVEGVECALGRSLFDRRRDPIQTLAALFKLRDRLVHPKTRTVKLGGTGVFTEPGLEDFNPKGLAKFLAAVAVAAKTLSDEQPEKLPLDETSSFIAANRVKVKHMGEMAMHLPPHPVSDTPAPTLLDFPVTRTAHLTPVPARITRDATGGVEVRIDPYPRPAP